MQHVAQLPVAVRQKSVLLVDDSALQRELAAELLHSLGLRSVAQAGNGVEALALLDSLAAQGQPLPLLILDLEMPDMDGIELLQRLRERALRPTVLLASGCEATRIDTVMHSVRSAGLPLLGCLAKPLDGQALHRLLMAHGAGPAPADLDPARVRPHYQPRVALHSGRLLGYQVSAHCSDADGRTPPCAALFAWATEHGQLATLTFSLLDQLLADLRHLHSRGATPRMALELEGSLLAQRSFANQLIARVRASGVQASQLTLHLPAHSLHDPAMPGVLGRLRLAGFGLSDSAEHGEALQHPPMPGEALLDWHLAHAGRDSLPDAAAPT